MASSENVENTALVAAAEEFLAAAKDLKGDDSFARMALAKKADNLRYLSEGPMDTIFRQWDTVHLTAALNVLVSTGALQKIPTEGAITSEKIAEAVGLDESVITRAMRYICVQGIAEEREPNIYAHNEKSLAYIAGTSKAFFDITVDYEMSYNKLPQYFKTHTREDFFDMKKSPYAWAHDCEGMTYYEAISADPERLNMFGKSLMQIEKTIPVLGMFPFASLEKQVKAEPDRPFIVDVGGGRGQILMSIQKEAPSGFGAEIILQDRPDVLDSIPPEDIPNVTKMAYDFFEPQPIKNAHLYLLSRILHDFYEPVCIQIVRNIANAMGLTSRLLIKDFVLPEKTKFGDDLKLYWMDFAMMMLTGQEKTAGQFQRILEAAGLELVKIWPFPVGGQAIVEAKLKNS